MAQLTVNVKKNWYMLGKIMMPISTEMKRNDNRHKETCHLQQDNGNN